MSLIPTVIKYDVFRNPQKEGEELKYHIRLAESNVVEMDEMLNEHLRSSQIGDVKSLFTLLLTAIKEELRRGQKVHLEGLGLFEPVLTADVERRQTPYQGCDYDVDNVRIRNIAFKPESQFMKDVRKEVSFKYKCVPHNYTPDDQYIDYMLTWIFQSRNELMRRDLTHTMAMPPKAATRLLDRLTKEGRLKRMGRHGASYYIPTPGNFGR